MPCACIQVRKVAEENGVDVSESIRELEERAKQVHTADCTWTWSSHTLVKASINLSRYP